jgi:4'-phosphopantetheinyl transferase
MSATGLLEPCCWRLEQPPPGPGELRPPPEAADPLLPLLLLIDRRHTLAPPLRAEFAACLSRQERQRHAALRRPDDRERFLLGRGALRRLLGTWLELAPVAVPIESGPHGKPRCPGGPEFNVSHSGDLILLALHPSRPVGVDVEQARPGLPWWLIARRVLPPVEWEALEALAAAAPAAAADAFLAAWCRLEARLKAEGRGLAGLGDFRRPGGAAATRGPGDAAPALFDVAVPAGYRAAVALGV